jgi:hypothetical protein
VLIDVVAGLALATEGRIEPALHGQLSKAVTQLRLAQVESEGQAGAGPGVTPTAPSSAAAPGSARPNAGPMAPTPPSGAPAAPGGPGEQGGGSRLWVPGR